MSNGTMLSMRYARLLDRATAVILLVVAAAYLVPFVPRGWIPHDEGTIGLDSVRLLGGELPHIGFEDPYTGGMTWFYAGVFHLMGVDLVSIRWTLFVGAIVAVFAWYLIARRFAEPLQSSAIALVALAWSFPNYFAGLPSWWSLIFASLAAVFFLCFFERRRMRWLVAAGLMIGLACAFKQTGIYLVAAGYLSLMYDEQIGRARRSQARVRWGAMHVRIALLAAIAAGLVALTHSSITTGIALRLLVPLAALGALVLSDEAAREESPANRAAAVLVRRLIVFTAAAGVPVCLLLLTYLPADLLEWFRGALLLPQVRLVGAAKDFPALWLSLPALLAIVAVMDSATRTTSAPRFARVMLGLVPAGLVLASYRTAIGHELIWNSAVAFGCLSPALTAAVLRLRDTQWNRVLFLLSAITGFLSLYQFPFAAPIYFCYAAPFALLSSLLLLGRVVRVSPITYAPTLAALAVFAVLSLNRGYPWNIGLVHQEVVFDAPLALPRASLVVGKADAVTYRRLVELVQAHATGPFIHAFPDCPEVYYLSGFRNPRGANFDFFAPLSRDAMAGMWDRLGISVVVLNRGPLFTPAPDADVLAVTRARFPSGETVGRFEVRWR